MGKTPNSAATSSLARKHPHGRGEDISCGLSKQKVVETPPRAWGRPRRLHTAIYWRRNTPTGVGKTVLLWEVSVWHGKHPHGRGEDTRWREKWKEGKETPPRAWGRPCASLVPNRHGGNTPTGVGKTTGQSSSPRAGEKHPHGRGEDPGFSSGVIEVEETPPRAWGRLTVLGIIITYY